MSTGRYTVGLSKSPFTLEVGMIMSEMNTFVCPACTFMFGCVADNPPCPVCSLAKAENQIREMKNLAQNLIDTQKAITVDILKGGKVSDHTVKKIFHSAGLSQNFRLNG